MKKFALMNMLLKGSAVSIQKALSLAKVPEYGLRLFSFDPKNIDPVDTEIKTVGLVFKILNDEYMSADELPFASMPDIKFICMGDGEDDGRCDGTYAMFKDFGETCVHVCYRFSWANPHMEEFEGQYDVLEQVQESFLDHVWAFEYEDYACGEFLKYAFQKDQEQTLVAMWNDDSRYNKDGLYVDAVPLGVEFYSIDDEDDYDEEIEEDFNDEAAEPEDYEDCDQLAPFPLMNDTKQKEFVLFYRNKPQQSAEGLVLTGRLARSVIHVGDQLSLASPGMTYISCVRKIIKTGRLVDSAQIGDIITLHFDNFSLAKTAFTFETWGGMCKDQYGVYMSGFVGGDSISVGESVKIVHPDDTEKVYVVSRIEKFMQSCMTAEPGDDIKLYLENMSISDFTFRDKLMKL